MRHYVIQPADFNLGNFFRWWKRSRSKKHQQPADHTEQINNWFWPKDRKSGYACNKLFLFYCQWMFQLRLQLSVTFIIDKSDNYFCEQSINCLAKCPSQLWRFKDDVFKCLVLLKTQRYSVTVTGNRENWKSETGNRMREVFIHCLLRVVDGFGGTFLIFELFARYWRKV